MSKTASSIIIYKSTLEDFLAEVYSHVYTIISTHPRGPYFVDVCITLSGFNSQGHALQLIHNQGRCMTSDEAERRRLYEAARLRLSAAEGKMLAAGLKIVDGIVSETRVEGYLEAPPENGSHAS